MKTGFACFSGSFLVHAASLLLGVDLFAQTAPNITIQPTNQTATPNSTTLFTVGVSGTGPLNYQWQLNGSDLAGIITVAGNGNGSFGGDGGPATNASLYFDCGLAVDGIGDVYIADSDNNRIRKVDVNGIITTVAGNGNGFFSGDGNFATNAGLSHPVGVALDGLGNLFIADYYNNRVRKVDASGLITTVAGTGSPTYSGDGGPATNASLYQPGALAFDGSGNLFIADQYNNRIRKVDTNGLITLVAGNGAQGYSGDGGLATNANLNEPTGLTLDSAGDLYIADTYNSRVRMVGTNGIIQTVAGTGMPGYTGDGVAATNSGLYMPTTVALDAAGNLWIADFNDNRIREVGTNGIITTVVGDGAAGFAGDGGPAIGAALTKPQGLALDSYGNIFIADRDNNRVREAITPGPSLTLKNVNVGEAGSYDVVVTSPYGSVTSAIVTLTVAGPPVIVQQPQSQQGVVGGAVNFNATVLGASLSEQWYFDNTALQGETNSVLTLTNLTTTNAGSYQIVAANSYGSTTSIVATLNVEIAPGIVSSPTNLMVASGTNAIFTVIASGTGPFSYQWQFNGSDLPGIITVAGNGNATFGGDGGPATNASLSFDCGLAVDGAGDVYIADSDNNRIRKVDGNGIITTVAGNGNGNFSGDGGYATNASLSHPVGVALDGLGNLFIADYYNNRVRKVDASGVITTIAGTGSPTYSGDGGAATNASLYQPGALAFDGTGNLFIADQYNNRIRKVDTNGLITLVAGNGSRGYSGDGAAATNASLSEPTGLILDAAGDMYIADTYNSRVRLVGTNGVIQTVAGTGIPGYTGDGIQATNSGLYMPTTVALDASGNLWIADFDDNLIREVATNGIISTVVGNGAETYFGDGGPATNAALNRPQGMAFDSFGDLYIADRNNNRVREVFASGQSLDLHNVSIGKSGSYDVVVASSYGSVTSAVATLTVLGPPVITGQPQNQGGVVGGTASFSASVIGSPLSEQWYFDNTSLQGETNSALTLTNLTSTNAGSYQLVATNSYGSVTSIVATLDVEIGPNIISSPGSLTFVADSGSNAIFTVDVGGSGPFHYQWQYDGANLPGIITVAGNGSGSFGGDGGPATNASMNFDCGLAVDGSGNVFIADSDNNRIRKVDVNGIITTVAGNGDATFGGDGGPATNASLSHPVGVAVDGFGNLYIADYYNNRVRRVDTNGVITTFAGTGDQTYSGDGGLATNASLNQPGALAFDGAGNLFIADQYNNRIRKVDTNGFITLVAGNGFRSYSGDGGQATNASLNEPTGLTLDSAGDLYIADTYNSRIRLVTPDGVIRTVAGTGRPGYSGDGGSATNAGLYMPTTVALDTYGNLWIADFNDNRIREVGTNGIITTIVGNGQEAYLGDGGSATNAALNRPQGMAFDSYGNLYIADRNNNRVREAIAPGPMLVIKNVNAVDAGSYDVVVSNPQGSITSATASLSITPQPQIGAGGGFVGFAKNKFSFTLIGPANELVVIERSTNLVDWTPLLTNSSPTGFFYFSDPDATQEPMRLYRARRP